RNTAPFYARFTPYENPSAAYLEINGNRQFELNHQLALIGRSQHCNVILDTNEISPIHASIVRTRDGKYWLVVPIGIKVKVNHKRCVSMELHDGDVINVGNHTLSFKLSDIPLVQRVSAGSSGKIELPGHIQFHLEEPKTGPLTAPPTPSPSLIEIETRTDLAQFRSQERLTAQDISLDDLLNESNPSGIQLDTLPPDQPAAPSTALMERPASELTRQPGSVERNLTEAHATDLISPADSSLQLPSEAQLAAKPDSSSKSEIQLMDVFLDHMKSMQAEMMTQMRMNMEMMANFMVNLQQQHMEQVREELNHLNQINQELLYLRQCLLTTPKPGKSSALQKASSELTVADLEPVEPPEKQMAYKPVVLPPGNSTLPVPLEQRAQITGKTKRSKAPATPAPEPATASTQPDSPWPGNYTPTGPKESGPAASGPAPSHDWITKRIATLEGERQSRWEKMRQAVFGK
ncbi:MAG TPA: FHA domain-containing protein, partial [Gemmatales bacterium]|nr:FHA domain-containing protein [Gemmatales bacterium]